MSKINSTITKNATQYGKIERKRNETWVGDWPEKETSGFAKLRGLEKEKGDFGGNLEDNETLRAILYFSFFFFA